MPRMKTKSNKTYDSFSIRTSNVCEKNGAALPTSDRMSTPPPPSFNVASASAHDSWDESTVYFAGPEHSDRDNIELGGSGGFNTWSPVFPGGHRFFRRHW